MSKNSYTMFQFDIQGACTNCFNRPNDTPPPTQHHPHPTPPPHTAHKKTIKISRYASDNCDSFIDFLRRQQRICQIINDGVEWINYVANYQYVTYHIKWQCYTSDNVILFHVSKLPNHKHLAVSTGLNMCQVSCHVQLSNFRKVSVGLHCEDTRPKTVLQNQLLW